MMALYECDVCGYVYDEAKNELQWIELGAEWVCPVCESGKAYFSQKQYVSVPAESTISDITATDVDTKVAASAESASGTPAAAKAVDASSEANTNLNTYDSGSPVTFKGIGYPSTYKRHNDTKEVYMDLIHEMAVSGKSVIEAMGTSVPVIGWQDILFRGAQLDPFVLDEDAPVSTTTIIGKSADKPLIIEHPVFVTHMSFGALSRELKISLSRGSSAALTAMCSGEGGILPESMDAAYRYIFEYVPNLYSVTTDNLQKADAIEIKIGQGTKPGMGGHLPGRKVTEEIAAIRNKPLGKDIISPSRFKDINSLDDLKELVTTLRDISEGRPIGLKIAAGRIEKDLAAAAYAGADFVTLDGRGGSTGASPKLIKDATTVPTIYALARARRFLDENSLAMDLVITGGFRVSSDFAKALAMGADAIAIGTAAMMAVACQQYRVCHSGKCPVGCATQDPELRSRLHPDKGGIRLFNYLNASREDLKTFARICGKDDVHKLSLEDIFTVNREISEYTDIDHA